MNLPANRYVIVACKNSEGCPELVPVIVVCTQAQFNNGDHYAAARECVEDSRYEGAVWAADSMDLAGSAIQLDEDLWDKAPKINIDDR